MHAAVVLLRRIGGQRVRVHAEAVGVVGQKGRDLSGSIPPCHHRHAQTDAFVHPRARRRRHLACQRDRRPLQIASDPAPHVFPPGFTRPRPFKWYQHRRQPRGRSRRFDGGGAADARLLRVVPPKPVRRAVRHPRFPRRRPRRQCTAGFGSGIPVLARHPRKLPPSRSGRVTFLPVARHRGRDVPRMGLADVPVVRTVLQVAVGGVPGP
mmetsp:Transcript_12101/g.21676  ORF Transcript_12101/g.21676 Transcript_12101/m.21676 type:complete len:209 (+) Transcript_12101:1237-1863(+)